MSYLVEYEELPLGTVGRQMCPSDSGHLVVMLWKILPLQMLVLCKVILGVVCNTSPM